MCLSDYCFFLSILVASLAFKLQSCQPDLIKDYMINTMPEMKIFPVWDLEILFLGNTCGQLSADSLMGVFQADKIMASYQW